MYPAIEADVGNKFLRRRETVNITNVSDQAGRRDCANSGNGAQKMLGVWHIAELTGISQVRALLNRGRRTGGLNDNRAGARRRVAPGVGCDVVDRVCRYF